MRARRSSALTAVLVFAPFFSACSQEPPPAADQIYGRGGETLWIDTATGRLKAESYATPQRSEHPVLVVILHGDLYNPTPSYQYAFAQALTNGFDAPALPDAVRTRFRDAPGIDDVVAVRMLRPGYTDNAGDRSAGERGDARGDNGLGHNIMFQPVVFEALERLLSMPAFARR